MVWAEIRGLPDIGAFLIGETSVVYDWVYELAIVNQQGVRYNFSVVDVIWSRPTDLSRQQLEASSYHWVVATDVSASQTVESLTWAVQPKKQDTAIELVISGSF